MQIKYNLLVFMSFFLFIFYTPLPTFGAWEGCQDQVNRLLESDREQYILNENEAMFDKLNLGQCEGQLGINLMVAIHEGVHFLDLNLTSIELGVNLEEINLYMTDMSRLAVPHISLPSPYDILENETSSLPELNQAKKTSIFFTDYESYILDRDMKSSSFATSGFGTEFNAYAHGTLSGLSLQPLTNEFQSKAIGPTVTQRSGVLFYFGVITSYFKLLKRNHPTTWKKLINQNETINFYRQLFNQGFESLKASQHCDSNTQYEIEYTETVEPLIDDKILSVFKVDYDKSDFLNFSICK